MSRQSCGGDQPRRTGGRAAIAVLSLSLSLPTLSLPLFRFLSNLAAALLLPSVLSLLSNVENVFPGSRFPARLAGLFRSFLSLCPIQPAIVTALLMRILD